MDLFLAICQGLGLALAIGIGGALVALFVAAMASLGAGIEPEGTDYSFLAEPWFVVVLLVAVVAGVYLRDRGFARTALLGVAGAVGGIAFAASLAEAGETAVPGLIVGAAVAVGATLVAGGVLSGAQRRAAGNPDGANAANTLVLIFGFAGIAAAAAALFLPPLALVIAAALAWLARGRMRRSGEKYEGLRILR